MKYFKWITILFLISSCVTFYPYARNYFEIQKEYKIKIGNPIAQWESGYKNNEKTYAIRKELIYTGLEHQNIKIIYREYFLEDSKNKPYFSLLARSSFFIDLNYDLNVSKIIAYQDLKIKILSANNEEIKFIILQAPKEYYKIPKKQQTDQQIDEIFGD